MQQRTIRGVCLRAARLYVWLLLVLCSVVRWLRHLSPVVWVAGVLTRPVPVIVL